LDWNELSLKKQLSVTATFGIKNKYVGKLREMNGSSWESDRSFLNPPDRVARISGGLLQAFLFCHQTAIRYAKKLVFQKNRKYEHYNFTLY
jgi:hypothetical protein